jgi:hypothetical protein
VAIEGVDYSWSRPPPSCLRSLGKVFACRYFGAGTSDKHATKAECAALHAMGLAVVALCEGYERDPLKGRAEGQRQARLADSSSYAAGLPADRPIYFAVDFDMTVAQRPAVRAFLDGCADIIGRNRVGVYGGIRTTEWASTNRYASWLFQTYAWSGGVVGQHTHLYQYRNGQRVCGGDVDLCRATVTDYGQWPHATETIGSAPIKLPAIQTQGPWDYTDVIAGVGGDVARLAASLDDHERALRGLIT